MVDKEFAEYAVRRLLTDKFLWNQWVLPTILSLAALVIAIAK